MKLNLGCGNDVRQGYVNVDFRQTHPAVMRADLSRLPWPFENESADEILMLDFLEHFPYAMTSKILDECFRIMKTGGKLVVQVPDFEHVSRAITGDRPYMCNKCGHHFSETCTLEEIRGCPDCEQTYRQIADAAVARLFGGQDYEGNYHQTTFDKGRLRWVCYDAGFARGQWVDDDHQYANWNICGEFVK